MTACVLGAFAFLGAMSIGLFMVPVVGLLVGACAVEGPSDRVPGPRPEVDLPASR
jgi:hypothetical protein